MRHTSLRILPSQICMIWKEDARFEDKDPWSPTIFGRRAKTLRNVFDAKQRLRAEHESIRHSRVQVGADDSVVRGRYACFSPSTLRAHSHAEATCDQMGSGPNPSLVVQQNWVKNKIYIEILEPWCLLRIFQEMVLVSRPYEARWALKGQSKIHYEALNAMGKRRKR